MENGELNPKLKHISIKYHFNKDNIEKNLIKLKYINYNRINNYNYFIILIFSIIFQ